jgi:membrane protein
VGRPVSHLRAWWPGRIAIRCAESFTRAELVDRSMTLAAQLFTSMIPILILTATWATRRDADRIADIVGVSGQSRSVLQDAVAAAGDTTFGVVGVVMVLFAATGVSRALTRAFAAVWELPRPKNNIRSAWRWLAVVVALVLCFVTARTLTQLVVGLPPHGVWPAVVSMCIDGALTLFVPWILLAGAVPPRLLLPGALIGALVGLLVRMATAQWLPQALQVSVDRYGTIGVAFAYLTYLYIVSLCFLATASAGHVIATDPGPLGRTIRAEAVAIRR